MRFDAFAGEWLDRYPATTLRRPLVISSIRASASFRIWR